MLFYVDILETLFLLLQSRRHNIQFTDVASCAKLVVELGCSFSQLSSDLTQYLEVLTSLLQKENRSKQEKQDLLMVAYHCCRNVVVDSRFEVCRFTESISRHIHEVFRKDLPEETKESMFRLMDLAIVVHHPNLDTGRNQLEYVADGKVWNTQLRNFWHIVKEEAKEPLKTKYLSHTKHELNQVFTQFAARLCFLIHWDDTIWMEADNEEASTSKKARRDNKLQVLMNLAQPCNEPAEKEINWNWLTIIGEVIGNYPSALENHDFQQMLQMLAECQKFIAHPSNIYGFTKCCYILLQQDENFNATANTIIANLCRDMWHKIADGAARVCTSNNKHSIEYHSLLQMLICHQKYPSSSFIEDVIKIFLTQSSIKCDGTLQTLISVLETFNLDSFPSDKKLPQKILSYVFEKQSLTNLKKVITTAGSEKPSARVLTKVGVICCLSKTDVVNYAKRESLDQKKLFEPRWYLQLESQIAYKKEIAEIIHNILLKANERLLIEDEDFFISQDANSDKKKTEFPTEIKCILDQAMYEELQKLAEFTNKIIDEDKDVDEIRDYLQKVLENNEIMMNLADNFLHFEAFNMERFESSFIIKKIDFHMQEIERLFELINQKTSLTNPCLDMKETHQLLTLVKALFSSSYHKEICLRIRKFKLDDCIRWVSRQVNHNFRTRNDDGEEMRIGWDEFVEAKMEERLKFLAIETFFEYNNFDGVNTETIAQRVWNIQLNCNDNMDLHTILHLLKSFRKQESVPVEVAEWIWSFIVTICSDFCTHQYISNRIIESLQDIVHISKNHTPMTTNVVQIFFSFGRLCVHPEYNPMTTVKFVQQFKHFHQVSLVSLTRRPHTFLFTFRHIFLMSSTKSQ